MLKKRIRGSSPADSCAGVRLLLWLWTGFFRPRLLRSVSTAEIPPQSTRIRGQPVCYLIATRSTRAVSRSSPLFKAVESPEPLHVDGQPESTIKRLDAEECDSNPSSRALTRREWRDQQAVNNCRARFPVTFAVKRVRQPMVFSFLPGNER